jgi:hypothetical protein
VGSALRSFLVVVEFEELVVVVSPERLPRRAGRGLGAQRRGFAVFLLERFLFVFRERFFLLGQTAIRKRTPQRVRRLHYDLFGSGRGTSTLNLQIELFGSLSGRVEGAPFQRVFFA